MSIKQKKRVFLWVFLGVLSIELVVLSITRIDWNKHKEELVNRVTEIIIGNTQADKTTTPILMITPERKENEIVVEKPVVNNNIPSVYGRFPQASERLLTDSDLRYLSKEELKIMRNEIFARHGYIFQTEAMKTYFRNQSWYSPLYSNVNAMLTGIEHKNIALIKSYE